MMNALLSRLAFLLLGACLLLFVACDSGGSNESDVPSGQSPVTVTNALDGAITAEVSSPDVRRVTVIVDETEREDGVAINQESSTQSLSLSDGSATATLQDPDAFVAADESASSEDDPDGFQEYAVRVRPPSGTNAGVELTMSLLVDGTKIAETSSPKTEGVPTQAGEWVIEVSSP
jgi:hypothetical protein